MMGMLDKKNKKEKDMAIGRLPPAGRGPSQAFGLAWASSKILSKEFEKEAFTIAVAPVL